MMCEIVYVCIYVRVDDVMHVYYFKTLNKCTELKWEDTVQPKFIDSSNANYCII